MEWQTVLGSALGSSPAAALSFYWAKAAWSDRKEQAVTHQTELDAKDALIKSKDEQIQNLQNQRIADLREIMITAKPKPPGSKPPSFGWAE